MPTRLEIGLKQGFLLGVMLCALLPLSAKAGLGGTEATIPRDATQLNATVKSLDRGTYRVHELQTASGTLVREFANGDGNIFAVAWSGPSIPNMRQALGDYFDRYVTAAKAHRFGRNHLEIHQSDWVLESNGHMRAFSGRAYLPQAIPTGTSLDELR